MVAEDEVSLERLRLKAALEASRGVTVDVLAGADLRRLAPYLSGHLVGVQNQDVGSIELTRSWRAPVTFSLPGKGLTAAVRALKGLGGVFLRSTVAVAPARVDAFGPIGFGHCFRGLDGIGRFWAAVLAKMGLDPSHDLRLAGTSEDCQACRFLLRGQPEGVL